MTAPWWTAADQAELELLLYELVDGCFEHRSWCREEPCRHVGEASEAMLAWRRRRELKSKAAFLRAREDALATLEPAARETVYTRLEDGRYARIMLAEDGLASRGVEGAERAA